MKKILMIIGLLALSSTSVFAEDEQELIDRSKLIETVNTIMGQRNLQLITEGESRPYIDDQNSFVFRLGSSSSCSDQFCESMMVSMTKTSKQQCFLDLPQQAIGTLPVDLVDESKGYFTVSTLTDKEAKNRDYFIFYKQDYCLEFAYGRDGEELDNLTGIANFLLKEQ